MKLEAWQLVGTFRGPWASGPGQAPEFITVITEDADLEASIGPCCRSGPFLSGSECFEALRGKEMTEVRSFVRSQEQEDSGHGVDPADPTQGPPQWGLRTLMEAILETLLSTVLVVQ